MVTRSFIDGLAENLEAVSSSPRVFRGSVMVNEELVLKGDIHLSHPAEEVYAVSVGPRGVTTQFKGTPTRRTVNVDNLFRECLVFEPVEYEGHGFERLLIYMD